MTAVRSDAWSDFELQLLYDVINDVDWFEQVEPYIGRSATAMRVRMSKLRREAEIEPKHRGARSIAWPREHRRKSVEASSALAAALAALDGDSSPARRAEDESVAPALSEHDRREADTLREVHAELLAFPRPELQLALPLNGPLFDWRATRRAA